MMIYKNNYHYADRAVNDTPKVQPISPSLIHALEPLD